MSTLPEPRESEPRESTARAATPREATLREATAREATLREATPREATAREATARESTSASRALPPAVRRTRVVLADIARDRGARRTTNELTQQSPVGDALLRGLIRAQLALALRLAAVVVVGLGSLPLLFALAPDLGRLRPVGIALPWLLLGVVAYPFLYAVGRAYVHLSERTEAEFTDLVDRR